MQEGLASGAEISPLSRTLGEAALHLLRHRMVSHIPAEVIGELSLSLETQLAQAREEGAVLDPVVEALCELVLREG